MTLRDRALRLRWWTALAMIALVVGSVAASVASIVITTQHNSVAAADEIVGRIGDRTADLVDARLATATQTLEMLTLIASNTTQPGASRSFETLLATQVITSPEISGAFVALPDGGFRFVRRDGDSVILKRIDTTPTRVVTESVVQPDLTLGASIHLPDDTYDPRSRPWYAAAALQPGAIWTDPYVFFSTGEPGVTTAKAVRTNTGEARAVIGVDVDLLGLSTFLDDLPVDAAADAFILAEERIVAASARHEVARPGADGSLVLATPGDVGIEPEVLGAAVYGNHPIALDDGGRLHVVDLPGDGTPDWAVAVLTEEIDFVDVVRQQSRVALVSTVVAALALLAVILVFVARLGRPLDELSRRARLDPLTSLPNRETLLEEGRHVLRRPGRHDDVMVAVLDIDDFKSVNDVYGHTAGDEAIRRVAAGIRSALRPSDLAGRLGGDEFVVVAEIDHRSACLLLEDLRVAVVDRLHRHEATAHANVTIGAVLLDGRQASLEALIEEADGRLLSAKRAAKGSIAW